MKTITKNLISHLIVLLLVLFSSCDKDASDIYIIGKWNIDKFTIIETLFDESSEETHYNAGTITFANDESGVFTFMDEISVFTWTLSDNVLILKEQDGNAIIDYIIEQNNKNELILDYHREYEGGYERRSFHLTKL